MFDFKDQVDGLFVLWYKKVHKLSPSLSDTQNQWIPDLNLINQDSLNIRNNEEIDDFIILQVINLLQKHYSTIATQCVYPSGNSFLLKRNTLMEEKIAKEKECK